MDAVEFKEVNVIYGQCQSEYIPLPAHKTKDGVTTVCFKLSEEEISEINKNGVLWLTTMTFNNPLQPIRMTTSKPELC